MTDKSFLDSSSWTDHKSLLLLNFVFFLSCVCTSVSPSVFSLLPFPFQTFACTHIGDGRMRRLGELVCSEGGG